MRWLKMLPTIVVPVIIIALFIIAWPTIRQFVTGDIPLKTDISVIVLERIQEMSTLITVRYNYSTYVVTQRDISGLLGALYGDKMAMVAVGYVNAGIDLSEIRQRDIEQVGNTLRIYLPQPQLTDCYLDETATYVISRDSGLFARPAANLDDEARKRAVEQFRTEALEAGILNTAQEQGELVIKNFLELVQMDGIEQVEIISTEIDAATQPEMPSSCQIS